MRRPLKNENIDQRTMGWTSSGDRHDYVLPGREVERRIRSERRAAQMSHEQIRTDRLKSISPKPTLRFQPRPSEFTMLPGERFGDHAQFYRGKIVALLHRPQSRPRRQFFATSIRLRCR